MRYLLLLAVLLWAAPAWSVGTWTKTCDASGNAAGGNVPSGGFACWDFEQLGDDIDSPIIECSADSCLFRFDPADDSDGADTATVWIRCCTDQLGTPDDNRCPAQQDAVLTGAGGSDSTQRFAHRVARGSKCYVNAVTDGDNDDNPYVSITGE
jgi:hypothetical protein